MDSKIEVISELQKHISNQLLILAAEETAYEHKATEEKRKSRLEHVKDLKNKLLGGTPPTMRFSLDQMAQHWWSEEKLWLESLSGKIIQNQTERLLYRLLAMFGRNHAMCPFVSTKKPIFGKETKFVDSDFFEKAIAMQLKKFCRQSQSIVEEIGIDDNFQLNLRDIEEINLDEKIYSARHRLEGKDFKILKGIVVGGSVGVLSSIALGPVIGTYIGELAGLSGAAAASYGMALLGGGSLASGGFGMAGGQIVLGILFASKGLQQGVDDAEIDLINMSHAMKNLPILLAIGRILKETIEGSIHRGINKKITRRAREYEDRETDLMGNPEENKQRLSQVRATRTLYDTAKELSKTYDWATGYDYYRKVF